MLRTRETARLRGRLASFLGLSLPSEAPPVTVLERLPKPGYTRSLIRYVGPDGDAISAVEGLVTTALAVTLPPAIDNSRPQP